MMEHECKQEDVVREMSGDIKSLLSEFRAMNGQLKQTQKDFRVHETESDGFRYKITIMWFIMQGIKWTIGGGVLSTLLVLLYKYVNG